MKGIFVDCVWGEILKGIAKKEHDCDFFSFNDYLGHEKKIGGKNFVGRRLLSADRADFLWLARLKLRGLLPYHVIAAAHSATKAHTPLELASVVVLWIVDFKLK